MNKLVLLFVFLGEAGFGEDLDNGIGMIYPSKPSVNQMGTYMPASGFNVFSKQKSFQVIGNLILEKKVGDYSEVVFKGSKNETYFQLAYTSITQVSYNNTVVVFFERSNGFVKIIDKEKDFWLNEEEVFAKGFRILNWSQFLIENSEHVIGYFPKNPGLNLRDSPSKEGKLIKTLLGESYQIILTPTSRGSWVKAKVMKLKDGPVPCANGSFEYELEGWIKLLDDSGTPNVTFFFDC